MRRTSVLIAAGLILLVVALFGSCMNNQFSNARVVLTKPAHFPELHYDLDRNPLTEKGIALGRQLFYDPLLSADGTVSCGSCHRQLDAFADGNQAFSKGVANRRGARNTPALQNLAFYRQMMWDGGVFDLDLQPLAPLENHNEMDARLDQVLHKLRQDENYPARFKQAFGSAEISSARMLQAFSQFLVTLVSANSRYDRYIRRAEGVTFTQDEVEGWRVFRQHCQSCHATELFTDQQFRNNGLAPASPDDLGREAVTLHPSDKYKFRVPSLRNVALTPPYMHDGRYQTLDDVIDHYRNRVVASATLDPKLRATDKPGIVLTDQEAIQVRAFLHTLTDESFLRDPRFAPPN